LNKTLELKRGDIVPIEKLPILENVNDTLIVWKRKLEYLLGNLDNDNVSTTTLTLGANQVKASNIDFGTGANQVDASDISIIDSGGNFSGDTIEVALSELSTTLNAHMLSTGIHFNTTTITSLVPINSTNILYTPTTAFLELSTTLTGTTSLSIPVALSSDLIATNNVINSIRTKLINLGIYTT
jgi:hypothetical protein